MQQKVLPRPNLQESSADEAIVKEGALGALTVHGKGE
jgi:hypothetical protein